MDFRLYFRSRQGELVHLLKQLVTLESPTQDKKAVDACASFVAKELKKVGCKVTTHPQKDTGDLVVAEFAPGHVKDADDEILVLTHVDTVWPVGKIAKMPFYVQGDRLYGPGVLDMKAGMVMLLAALRALHGLNVKPQKRITVLVNSAEETGSDAVDGSHPQAGPQGLARPLPRTGPSRRGPEARAEGTPRRPHGRPGPVGPRRNAAKRASAPSRSWSPRSAASSACGPAKRPSTSASSGAARRPMSWPRAPGPCSTSGSGRPRTANASSRSSVSRSRTCTAPGSRSPSRARRRPMEKTKASDKLFVRAQEIAGGLGLTLKAGKTGGGSDASIAAGQGVPTLDGLGPDGDGIHAETRASPRVVLRRADRALDRASANRYDRP